MHAYLVWALVAAAALLTWGAVLAGLLSPQAPDTLTLQYFSGDFLSRADQYQRIGLSLYLIRQALALLILTAFALAAWRFFAPGFIFLFLLLYQLLNLPLGYYRGFVLEHRFGFSNYTAAAWLLDYGKSVLISIIATALSLIGLYFLMLRVPNRWWLPAGAALAFFIFLGVYLYPLIIDPLFYRFQPLEDREINGVILEMAGKAGIGVEQVLVADASRRTSKANAYFTGMGGSKRIVLFDTLLNNFSREEILLVVAHEMGHWQHRHIIFSGALGAASGFAALYLLFLLLSWMGVQSDFRAIPLTFLFIALLTLGASPAENYISRTFERQADRAAVALTGDAATLIALQQRLAETNLLAVRPHALIKFALYTHPPTMERIEQARSER